MYTFIICNNLELCIVLENKELGTGERDTGSVLLGERARVCEASRGVDMEEDCSCRKDQGNTASPS